MNRLQDLLATRAILVKRRDELVRQLDLDIADLDRHIEAERQNEAERQAALTPNATKGQPHGPQ